MFGFPGFLVSAAAILALTATQPSPAASHAVPADPRLPAVLPNDNTGPAGVFLDDTLTLNLRAAVGEWRPEGDTGPALRVEAFGEDGDALRAPSPLIRVPEATQIVVTIRNELEATLRIHGLCARDGKPCAPLDVPPAATRQTSFMANRVGTFHYWATTTGMPLEYRAAGDTQLAGAFVVDPIGAAPNADRVLVITDWTSLTKQQLKELIAKDDPGAAFMQMKPQFTALINGLAWPATERLTYRLGERVRWRVLNLSTQLHPMHLHGFYFDLDSVGDGWKDTPFADDKKPHVVTHLMNPGATMAMAWTPERVGNWLFHCHRMLHVAPERRLAVRERPGDPETLRGVASDAHAGHHAAHDPSAGMAGMVLGVTVTGAESPENHGACEAAPRKLTLEMRSEPNRFGDRPAYGFVLSAGSEASASGERKELSAPGPTLVLQRDEPVEITLVNRMPEGTAVHWHGIELDSYYDGVHGWSGAGRRVTPMIEPGGTFVVRFTPPRTGTFIYHTHLHDHQLASGLYGAIVVVAPGETFDPETDHVVVMGRRGPAEDAPAVLNGEPAPGFSWKAGVRHRIRFINITPDDVFVVSLAMGEGPVNWRPATKDGSPLPAEECEPKPARQTIAVGETYDFHYDAPPGRRNLWMEVRSPGGKWMVQGRVSLK